MAMLGDIYLFVEEEECESPVEVSEHPVEVGVALTDHVQQKPAILRLQGQIFGAEAEDDLARLQSWQRSGAVCRYIGQRNMAGVQIQSLSCRYTHKSAKGCSFNMVLREVRIASTMLETGLAYSGNMEVRFVNGQGVDRIVNLAPERERYHRLWPGETLQLLAAQYRSQGVRYEALCTLNAGRDIFAAGQQGNFDKMRAGAEILLGVW